MNIDDVRHLVLGASMTAVVLVFIGYIGLHVWRNNLRLRHCEASLRVHIDACTQVGRQLIELGRQNEALQEQVVKQEYLNSVAQAHAAKQSQLVELSTDAGDSSTRYGVSENPIKLTSIEGKLLRLMQSSRSSQLQSGRSTG